jgi:hypothetical protein
MVVFGHGSFAFKDLDEDTVLVVLVGGEDLGFFGWDVGVSGNEDGHDSSNGFDTLGEGADVKKENVSSSFTSGEDSTLDCGTKGDGFIRIDSSVWFFTVEVFFEEFTDFGDTSGSSNEDDFLDFVFLEFGVG